jgi:hypothetical protein
VKPYRNQVATERHHEGTSSGVQQLGQHREDFVDVASSVSMSKATRSPGTGRRGICSPHLYTINREILMTPFHNMARMCPASTPGDADAHTAVFTSAVDDLMGLSA